MKWRNRKCGSKRKEEWKRRGREQRGDGSRGKKEEEEEEESMNQ